MTSTTQQVEYTDIAVNLIFISRFACPTSGERERDCHDVSFWLKAFFPFKHAGNRILWDTGLLNGAPNKVELLAHYYVGETVTAIQKTSLVPGGQEVSSSTPLVT